MPDASPPDGRTLPLAIAAVAGIVVLVAASGGGGGPLLASLGALGVLMTAMSLVMLLQRHADPQGLRATDPGPDTDQGGAAAA